MRLTPLLRLRHTTPLLESLTIPAAPRAAAPSTLAYHVSRTASNGIPVYLQRKAGGTRRTTQIRRVAGDPVALRDELRAVMPVKQEDVFVSPTSGNVIVKVSFAAFPGGRDTILGGSGSANGIGVSYGRTKGVPHEKGVLSGVRAEAKGGRTEVD